MFLLFLTGLPFNSKANAQNYQIAHCYQGCPLGGSADNHLIIRPIYALSYNTETKSADWVSYNVSADSIGIASSLSRSPIEDNYVTETLKNEDIFESDSQGLIRAQYVPLVDFAGSPYWNEVNYLSNSVARTSSLSQGAWYGLDWAIRNYVNRRDEVFVLTGPIFEEGSHLTLEHSKIPHRVPDSFFKIVVTEEGKAATFLLRQDSRVHQHHCDMRSSIEEIEKLTGLVFFPRSVEVIDESAFIELGCI